MNQDTVRSSLDGTHIYFYCDVTDQTVMELTILLREAEDASINRRARNGTLHPSEPVHVHICSAGGSVVAGLAAYNNIRALQVPVVTYAEGLCASAGTLLSVAGDHRVMGKSAFYLIHQIQSWQGWSKLSDIDEKRKNSGLMEKAILKAYTKNSKLTKSAAHDIMQDEIMLTATKALKLGLIDELM